MIIMLRYGSIPKRCHRKKPRYRKSINIEPWAKLITLIMPKIRLSPIATTAYKQPNKMPATKAAVTCSAKNLSLQSG